PSSVGGRSREPRGPLTRRTREADERRTRKCRRHARNAIAPQLRRDAGARRIRIVKCSPGARTTFPPVRLAPPSCWRYMLLYTPFDRKHEVARRMTELGAVETDFTFTARPGDVAGSSPARRLTKRPTACL